MLHSQSGVELRQMHERPFRGVGRALIRRSLGESHSDSRPSSSSSSGKGDDLADCISDTLFNKQVRASLKRRSQAGHAEVKNTFADGPLDLGRFESAPKLSALHRSPDIAHLTDVHCSSTSQSLRFMFNAECRSDKPRQVPQGLLQVPTPLRNCYAVQQRACVTSSRTLVSTESPSRALGDKSQQAHIEARARMSACYEDLISFLEMHGLSGAYALAFSANGVETLEQLLTLDDDAITSLLSGCDMDAMDEIMVLSALRGSRLQTDI